METQTRLQEAQKALQTGDRARARLILQDLISQQPENAEAWQLLFTAVDNPLEKEDCLKNVVRIRPKDERTRQRLHKYRAGEEFREAKAKISAAVAWEEEERTRDRKSERNLKGFLSFLRELVITLNNGRRPWWW